MSQLIARIDDELHEQLKARAAAEGRSLNALVNDVLSHAVSAWTEKSRVRAELASKGTLVVPTPPPAAPSREAAIAATAGAGNAASAALRAERTRR